MLEAIHVFLSFTVRVVVNTFHFWATMSQIVSVNRCLGFHEIYRQYVLISNDLQK